jgi:hypothetical protein
MVDLGQTGRRNSACFILYKSQKKPTAFTIGFKKEVIFSYFSIAYNLATSVQLTTLKNASI